MAEEERKKTATMQIRPGLYVSMITNQNMNLLIRGVVLFSIGVFLALVLNLLQIQRNVTLFPPDVIASIFSSAWWVPPCCGSASGSSQKVDFANNTQLSLTLAALSIGLWWTFDRSRSGFGLGIGIAFIATLVTQLLVYNGVYQYTSPDFLYVRSWLPCIFFAGGITMGNIGRQLAMYECKVIPEKPHQD
ncbi:insulin-induced gene 2 protein isoform X2 [Callorhinchus milii]|uniref:insulin-induced gene 2 protein isoform X2 n=1 Tax=Callorhinchus milii TaxID=7868 RepID=UPI001C3F56D3|nr:insulin-induced gene 2 protein isoform X2 [Callorhinchus milii]